MHESMGKASIEKYLKCEICGSDLGKVGFDTPVYCTNCISEMEKLSMSPRKFIKYMELKETLKK